MAAPLLADKIGECEKHMKEMCCLFGFLDQLTAKWAQTVSEIL